MADRGEHDRFQFDGDQLDEIVLSNVTFHIERMSHHGWWLGVHDAETGARLDLWWNATGELVMENDEWAGIEHVGREPLTYACPEQWRDRRYGEHRCEVEREHSRHRCECGATRAATPTPTEAQDAPDEES